MNRNRFSVQTFFQSIPSPTEEKKPKRKRKSKSAPPTPRMQLRATPRTQEPVPPVVKKPYKKQKISAALREQVWVQHSGRVFERKCMVNWCTNTITVFDFQCGHDIPESKGGPTDITNLYPICGKCNLSMSNTYTFKEWCCLYKSMAELPVEQPKQIERSFFNRYFSCFSFKNKNKSL